jgi:hypothetical protein
MIPLDLDRLFAANNFSDRYEYKLRAKLNYNMEMYNDVTIVVKFVDSNNNSPRIRNRVPGLDAATMLEATIDEDYIRNGLVVKFEQHGAELTPEFVDADFSEQYGLRSLHFAVNDTRFAVENKYILHKVNHSLSFVSPQVKIVNAEGIKRVVEPVVWLNLTCEDNYFGRGDTDSKFHSVSILIKVQIHESKLTIDMSPFTITGDGDALKFTVDEGFVGVIGALNNRSTAGDSKNFTYSFDLSELDKETSEAVSEHLAVRDGQLYVVKPFDFETGKNQLRFVISAKGRLGENATSNEYDVPVSSIFEYLKYFTD